MMSRKTIVMSVCLALGSGLAAVAPLEAQTTTARRAPDVIYVPTPEPVVAAMLEVANVTVGDVVYDLGSGDGRIVIAAARDRGATGIGIDINPERIREARENAQKANVTDRVRFLEQDLFQTDVSPATVVTLYLLPSLNVRLRPTLLETLRPGTRVVSHSFEMGEWRSDSTFTVDGRPVHYWVVPADVTGEWTWQIPGAGRYTAELAQDFQYPRGLVTGPGEGAKAMVLSSAALHGDSISFTLAPSGTGTNERPMRFSGRVHGDQITGTVEAGGKTTAWRARKN